MINWPCTRKTSPLIRERLGVLLSFAVVIQNARNFLINSSLVSNVTQLPGYYDFAKRVFFHIRNHGYAGAVPLIESDLVLFRSWGFSGVVLRGLARLQGVLVEM